MHLRVIGHGPHPPELAFSNLGTFCGTYPKLATPPNPPLPTTVLQRHITSPHLLRPPTLTSKIVSTIRYSHERTPRLQLSPSDQSIACTTATIRALATPPRHTLAGSSSRNKIRATCTSGQHDRSNAIANRSSGNSSILANLSASGSEHNEEQGISSDASSAPNRARSNAPMAHAPNLDGEPTHNRIQAACMEKA